MPDTTKAKDERPPRAKHKFIAWLWPAPILTGDHYRELLAESVAIHPEDLVRLI